MPEFTITEIDTDNDLLTTSAAHGLTTGDAVGLHVGFRSDGVTAGVMPASTPELLDTGVYFARAASTTTVTLHQSKAKAVANEDAIDFTGEMVGGATLYMTRLSVLERILRRLRDIIAAADGIDGCQLAEEDGNELSVNGQTDVLLMQGDETADDEPVGNPGMTVCHLPLTAVIVLRRSEADRESTNAIVTRAFARVENAITADPFVIEASPSLQRLADYLTVTAKQRWTIVNGQPEFCPAIAFTVDYKHLRNNAYALTY